MKTPKFRRIWDKLSANEKQKIRHLAIKHKVDIGTLLDCWPEYIPEHAR